MSPYDLMLNLIAQATPEIPAWIEKIGTIGILGWMLWYFMKKSDSQQGELLTVTKSAVAAIEKFSGVMERIDRKLPEA